MQSTHTHTIHEYDTTIENRAKIRKHIQYLVIFKLLFMTNVAC